MIRKKRSRKYKKSLEVKLNMRLGKKYFYIYIELMSDESDKLVRYFLERLNKERIYNTAVIRIPKSNENDTLGQLIQIKDVKKKEILSYKNRDINLINEIIDSHIINGKIVNKNIYERMSF